MPIFFVENTQTSLSHIVFVFNYNQNVKILLLVLRKLGAFGPDTPPCVIVVFLLTYLCVYVSLYWQGFQQVSLVLVVPSPQIYINELRKSDNVTGWKWPQVGQQNVTQRSRV